MSRELAHVWPGTDGNPVGGLTGVEYVVQHGDPNCPPAVVLRFEGSILTMRHHPDDTCSFSPEPPALQPFEEILEVGNDAPVWKPLLGCRCAGIWSLVDSAGKSVGVRIRFATESVEPTLVELEVMGEGIMAYVVTPTNNA